jgi:hypothetical protein
MRVKKFILILLGIGLLAPAAKAQVSPQVGEGSGVLHFTSHSVAPSYHHDLSTAQIEGINNEWVPSRNRREPGLTAFHYGWKLAVDVQGLAPAQGGPVSIWASTINFDFSITQFDVYVSNQYAEGSCPYRVVLAHENNHVAINRENFEKYRLILKATLEKDDNFPTEAHPWKVDSLKDGDARIQTYLQGEIAPIVQRFKDENGLSNATIDLPDNYARLQAQCQDW